MEIPSPIAGVIFRGEDITATLEGLDKETGEETVVTTWGAGTSIEMIFESVLFPAKS
jgi:hypothetical protein